MLETSYQLADGCTVTFDEALRGQLSIDALGLNSSITDSLTSGGPLCFIDIETTGFDVATDRVIEIGAALLYPGKHTLEIFHSLISVDVPVPPTITRLTGIRSDDLVGKPPTEFAIRALDDFIGNASLVAHNAPFEQGRLQPLLPRLQHAIWLDTVDLFPLLFPDTPNLKQDTLTKRVLGRAEKHRGLDDAVDMLQLIAATYAPATTKQDERLDVIGLLQQYSPQSPWLAQLGNEPVRPFTLRHPEAIAITPDITPTPTPFDVEAISARLRDTELGARFFEHYVWRPEQDQYLRHVFDCFSGEQERRIHLCEAGTGVGKTLAYLAVAIPFAQHEGQKVLISTATKLLQRELLNKHIPNAAAFLGYPQFAYAYIMGRRNYVCDLRATRFLQEERVTGRPERGHEHCLAYLGMLAHPSNCGELDTVLGVLRGRWGAALNRGLRRLTSRDAKECRREDCEVARDRCPFWRARNRLQRAAIFVTNHDLLLRWPADYPPAKQVIVDEMHSLPGVADGAYALTFESTSVLEILKTIAAESPPAEDESPIAADARLVRQHLVQLGQMLKVLTRDKEQTELELTPQTYQAPHFEALLGLLRTIKSCVERLVSRLESKEQKGQERKEERGAEKGEKKRETNEEADWRAADLKDALKALNAMFPTLADGVIVKISTPRWTQQTYWSLKALYISPHTHFHANLIERVDALFGTSATLGTPGKPLAAVDILQLNKSGEVALTVHDPIESPFDYESHLDVVFVAGNSSNTSYNRNDLHEHVTRCINATVATARALGGRTMVLCASNHRLQRITDGVGNALLGDDFTLTRVDSRSNVHNQVREFEASEQGILLGARNLWQGVDIPGAACQGLVIEKYPFAFRSALVDLRETAAVQAGGGSGFEEYYLPQMLIDFRQMVGRLIRTHHDRGVVVIVDSGYHKPYFHRVLQALPRGAQYHLIPADELASALADIAPRILSP